MTCQTVVSVGGGEGVEAKVELGKEVTCPSDGQRVRQTSPNKKCAEKSSITKNTCDEGKGTYNVEITTYAGCSPLVHSKDGKLTGGGGCNQDSKTTPYPCDALKAC